MTVTIVIATVVMMNARAETTEFLESLVATIMEKLAAVDTLMAPRAQAVTPTKVFAAAAIQAAAGAVLEVKVVPAVVSAILVVVVVLRARAMKAESLA